MKYSQGQVRDVLGIGSETLRHWRKVLTPLQAKTGRTPAFTFGDIVAIALTQNLVERLGLNVGQLRDVGGSLFTLCNEMQWAQSEGEVLVLASEVAGEASGRPDRLIVTALEKLPDSLSRLNVAAVVPLQPVLARLRAGLIHEGVEAQRHLPFPPTPVRRRGEAA